MGTKFYIGLHSTNLQKSSLIDYELGYIDIQHGASLGEGYSTLFK